MNGKIRGRTEVDEEEFGDSFEGARFFASTLLLELAYAEGDYGTTDEVHERGVVCSVAEHREFDARREGGGRVCEI